LPASTGIVSSYAYDNANSLTGISHVKDGTTTIASVNYTLDAVGNAPSGWTSRAPTPTPTTTATA